MLKNFAVKPPAPSLYNIINDYMNICHVVPAISFQMFCKSMAQRERINGGLGRSASMQCHISVNLLKSCTGSKFLEYGTLFQNNLKTCPAT